MFEVAPLKDGVPVTLHMALVSADSSGTQLNGYGWLPLISERPKRSVTLSDNGVLSAISISHGSLSFRMSEMYENKVWSSYEWTGALGRIWEGELGQDFSSYNQTFEGSVSSLSRDGITATVELLGAEADLEVSLLDAEYAGTGGIEGTSDMLGKLKPRAFGYCQSVDPTQIDNVHLIYQVHGFGAINYLNVYVYALPLDPTKRKPDCATYDDLVALDLQPGEWGTCLAHGLFRLGASPSKKLSADVGVGATGLGDIVRSMLGIAGVPAARIGDFSAWTQTWNTYVTEQVTIGDTVREAMRQAGGYLLPDGQGVWRAGNYFAPQAPVALNGDRSSEPLVRSIRELNAAAPLYKVKVGYDRCWSVHSSSDISPLVLTDSEDLAAVQAAAEAAQEAAEQAASDAAALKKRIDAIDSDGILDRSEKPEIVKDFEAATYEHDGLIAQGSAYDVAAQRDAYETAFQSLKSYLEGLSPAYTDFTQDTPINRDDFNNEWGNWANAKAALLQANTGAAGTVAVWGGVTGPGKPADGATVGAPAGTYVGQDINGNGGIEASQLVAQLGGVTSNPAFDTDPPAVPTGLAISSTLAADGSVAVTFSWNANSEPDLAGYDLWAGNNGGNLVSLAGIAAPGTSYVQRSGFLPGQQIQAQLRARDRAGNPSDFSAVVTANAVRDQTPPAAPTAFSAQGTFKSIRLAWMNPSDTDLAGIIILRSTTKERNDAVGLTTVAALPLQGGSYTDTAIEAVGRYYYWIAAFDTSNNLSAEVGPVAATTESIDFTDFDLSVQPIGKVDALPNPVGYVGPDAVLLSTDKKLYRYKDGAWTKDVDGSDLKAGSVSTNALAADSVTAKQIAIADIQNIILNSEFTADLDGAVPTGWTRVLTANDGNNTIHVASHAGDGWPAYKALFMRRHEAGNQGELSITVGNYSNDADTNMEGGVAVDVGDEFYFQAPVYGSNGAALRITMSVRTSSTDQAVGASATIPLDQSYTTRSAVLKNTYGKGKAYFRLEHAAGTATANDADIFIWTPNISRRNAGKLIVDGAIQARHLDVEDIVASDIFANSFTGGEFKTDASLPGSITIGATGVSIETVRTTAAGAASTANTAYGWANDPITVANQRTTKITPGLVQIDGNTTLHDWSAAADRTRIDGGKLATQSVTSDKVTIGVQGVNFQGVTFKTDGGNTVSWTEGTVSYYDSANNWVVHPIAAGNYTYTGITVYIWYADGQTGLLADTKNYNSATDVQVAQYRGGVDLNVTWGRTEIDGSFIRTHSVEADVLKFGVLTGQYMAAKSISADKLYLGAAGVTCVGLDFQVNPEGTLLSWSSGYMMSLDNNGNAQSIQVSSGFDNNPTNTFRYIFWRQGQNFLFGAGDDWGTYKAQSDCVLVATWSMGTRISTNLSAGALLTGDRLVIGSVDAGVLKVNTIDAQHIKIGGVATDSLADGAVTNVASFYYNFGGAAIQTNQWVTLSNGTYQAQVTLTSGSSGQQSVIINSSCRFNRAGSSDDNATVRVQRSDGTILPAMFNIAIQGQSWSYAFTFTDTNIAANTTYTYALQMYDNSASKISEVSMGAILGKK